MTNDLLLPVRATPEGHLVNCTDSTIFASVFEWDVQSATDVMEYLSRKTKRSLEHIGAIKCRITVVITHVE